MAKIEQILEKYGSDPAEIQEILLDVQEEEGYLLRTAYASSQRSCPCPYQSSTTWRPLRSLKLSRWGATSFKFAQAPPVIRGASRCWMNSIPSLKSTLAR